MTGRRLLISAGLGLAAAAAAAQSTVVLAGTMGRRALLVIDGQPATLAVGESAAGVTLLQLGDGQAVVQQRGTTATLRLGGAPARLAGGAAPAAGGREIVIPVGLGGHYTTGGAINGRPVRFMVDTGATLVALGQAEADRLELPWRNGERALTQTANGPVAVHRVSLDRVRVGEVELNNIAAVVVPAAMPYVLLGNSFLSRFQLARDSDVLRLELKR
jgi:aspartyl protease family protein